MKERGALPVDLTVPAEREDAICARGDIFASEDLLAEWIRDGRQMDHLWLCRRASEKEQQKDRSPEHVRTIGSASAVSPARDLRKFWISLLPPALFTTEVTENTESL